MVNNNTRLAGRRGGVFHPEGGAHRRRAGNTAQKVYGMPQGRRGSRNSKRGVEEPPQMQHSRNLSVMEGGRPPPWRNPRT